MTDQPSRCEGCGLLIAGGTDGCQRLFDEFRVREIAELAPAYASTRLSIDVYCLQHPDRYCVSAKSLAAHLTGLAWALEYPGDERGLGLLQKWLNGHLDIQKPALPKERGCVTVAGIAGAEDADAYSRELGLWAQSTWDAYSELRGTARDWIGRSLAGR